MKGGAIAGIVLLASIAASARPFERDIDTAAIERAIALGSTPGSPDLARFHQDYTVSLGGPMLDRLEVITEFRRVVLASQQRARMAETGWGIRDAQRLLAPWRDKVVLVLHVVFPPNNTYQTMPHFGIVLYARPGTPGGERIEPLDLIETPRYVSGQPAPPGTPILAGDVNATFDAARLDPRGIYLAGIDLDGRELRRAEVNFGRIE